MEGLKSAKVVLTAVVLFLLCSNVQAFNYSENYDLNDSNLYMGDNNLIYFNGINSDYPGIPIPPLYDDLNELPDFNPLDYKVVELSLFCAFKFLSFACIRDKNLEIELEKEFWAYTLNTDLDGMREWLSKAIVYAENSKTPYAYRIYKLAAFGVNMFYAANPIDSPRAIIGISALLESLFYASKAVSLEPNDLMSIYTLNFVRAYLSAALFDKRNFKNIIEETIQYDDYGLPGYEGKTFGNIMSLFVADADIVSAGVQALGQCDESFCSKRPATVPNRRLGNVLATLEALNTLNRTEEASDLYSKTLSWAYDNDIHEVSINLFKEKVADLESSGVIEKWQSNKYNLGLVKMPAGPFQKQDVCKLCHSGMKIIPEYYEGRSK